eukprot:142007-Chlamydomonas_euryale.AAC.1
MKQQACGYADVHGAGERRGRWRQHMIISSSDGDSEVGRGDERQLGQRAGGWVGRLEGERDSEEKTVGQVSMLARKTVGEPAAWWVDGLAGWLHVKRVRWEQLAGNLADNGP